MGVVSTVVGVVSTVVDASVVVVVASVIISDELHASCGGVTSFVVEEAAKLKREIQMKKRKEIDKTKVEMVVHLNRCLQFLLNHLVNLHISRRKPIIFYNEIL